MQPRDPHPPSPFFLTPTAHEIIVSASRFVIIPSALVTRLEMRLSRHPDIAREQLETRIAEMILNHVTEEIRSQVRKIADAYFLETRSLVDR